MSITESTLSLSQRHHTHSVRRVTRPKCTSRKELQMSRWDSGRWRNSLSLEACTYVDSVCSRKQGCIPVNNILLLVSNAVELHSTSVFRLFSIRCHAQFFSIFIAVRYMLQQALSPKGSPQAAPINPDVNSRALSNPMPRHQSSTISPLTTFLILCVFLIALFPSLFHIILWAPYYYVYPRTNPATPTTVLCTAPSTCSAPSNMAWYVSLTTLDLFPCIKPC